MKELIGLDLTGRTDKQVYTLRHSDGTIEVLSDNELIKHDVLAYMEKMNERTGRSSQENT
jgi:hypothetical protein